MNVRLLNGAALRMIWVLVAPVWLTAIFGQEPSREERGGGQVVVVEIEGTVEVSRARANVWDRAYTNQVLFAGDRLRTLERSRAVVRTAESGLLRVGELSLLVVPQERRGFSLLRGIIYFFHRERPAALDVQTPTVSTLIRGTEFNLAVAETGVTTLSLFDGEVVMTNALGRLELTSGEQGIAAAGAPPRKTAVIHSTEVVQWALYYPAVVDPAELGAEAMGAPELKASLEAYRAGDLLRALELYPADRQPDADTERIYRASLLLSVGLVDEADRLLDGLRRAGGRDERTMRLANALRRLIAAVTGRSGAGAGKALELASEWLAESYYRQGQSDLPGAREAAERAVARSPGFSFALARLAELEFSFGRLTRAGERLARALERSPRHAEALALRGFLLAAENRIEEAIEAFDAAIAVDGALGNAWLGRGLCRIRIGQSVEGLRDLEVAAALEPQRALFRSYLGKALANAGKSAEAAKELELAKRMDPHDPTAWLYSALLNQQRGLINQAIRDLEHSQQLNDNRRVYRSRLLLDQDRAVRGANLANIYLDAGFVDLSAREAARAVSADYSDYSSHLFLAHSYNALRDPRQVNLRYETPWLSEYLTANLLAPAAAGILSPIVTQLEYSRLLERDRLGLASMTEYRSGGDWFQAAAQHGTYRGSAYAAEATYRSENGEWPNADLEQTTLSLRLKQEFGASDSVYFQALYYDSEGGDLAQHFSRDRVNETLRIEERQEPILLAGYHHRWGPGSHTLFLAGRLDDTLLVSDRQQQSLLFDRSLTGGIDEAIPVIFDQEYRSELEIYTAEAQQIWREGAHTIIAGSRVQAGEFETRNEQINPRFPVSIPLALESHNRVRSDFARASGYGYYHWRARPELLLIGGVSYDWVRFPVNHRFGPVTDKEEETDRISPKAGFVWTPAGGTTVRGGYARSLGGVSFDQSFQLEPTQVAGFNQAFRSLIPESAAGAATAPRFEIAGVSLEQQIGRDTFVSLSGEWLESEARRAVGVYEFRPGIVEAWTQEGLDYRERSLVFSWHQMLGEEWAAGLRYRLSRAELDRNYGEVPATAGLAGGFEPEHELEATLHQLNLFAVYNHSSGFFGEFDCLWIKQSSDGYSPELGDEDFWQFDLFAGYRFARRRAEVRVGVVNLGDQDYRLNPLNWMSRIPRERTLVVNVRLNF